MAETAAALAQRTRERTPGIAAQWLMFTATAATMVGNYYVYDSIAPVADLLNRQLGFSDTQIGTLNAVYSLPNIFMVLAGGVLVDRFSARSVVLATTVVCLIGALVTAFGSEFGVMVTGRLLFGLGAETMIVAVTVALAQWFAGRHFALLFAANLALARVGSYLADRSPTFASDLYAQGWQPPLQLAAAVAALMLAGGIVYWLVDRREAARGTLLTPTPGDRIEWRALLRFPAAYWYIVGLCVTFYAVIFPFRSTFAIKYFQHAHGLSLEEAGALNGNVFLAAAFATPAFGFLVDRIGRHGLLMCVGALLLPLSFVALGAGTAYLGLATVLIGISFSLVPAVLWPAVAHYVPANQLGTAYGLMTMLQNIGLIGANVLAGYINDVSGASAANPAGYLPMLWMFGLLGTAGLACAMMLSLRPRATAPIA